MNSLASQLHYASDRSFWLYVRAAFEAARNEGREQLTFAEWDDLFAIAVDDGIGARYASTKQFASVFGWPLYRLFLAIREARAQGVPEATFWRRWDTAVDGARLVSLGSTPGYRPKETGDTLRDRREKRRVEADSVLTTT